MTGPAIRVHDLVRDFRNVRALDHVTMDVPPGIVFGFLGPNGAGKTTLIRVLLGLAKPTSGYVEVLGRNPAREGDAVRASTGALLEHHGLYERLSARQNLEFFARIWRMPRHTRDTRIHELLSRFGLWERREEVVGTWSRGMKQRLAVARAVLHRPPLVFLDEPTAGLDPVASASLREELARLASDEGVTVFLTTHNLAEAERLCALVGVVRRGMLTGFGTPDALRMGRHSGAILVTASAGVTDALIEALGMVEGVALATRAGGDLRIEVRNGVTTPDLVRWLAAQGVDIEEVRPERATFEEAFLSLVDPASGTTQ
ncbi:MAG: ABC transporter ATP-binding protein [Cytophagaceae bacterium]|nr:ABC transporter ATP-binding protein [Gemmatimonadaceae bacterium]